MNILEQIAQKTLIRIEELKASRPLNEIKEKALSLPEGDFAFEKALSGDNISFICEVKKASPSKGLIDENFDYLNIAKEYRNAGAAAISCLTEPYWFLGQDSYLSKISKEVKIPVLRKDFTLDEYQIYEAKTIGAQAVLLICALLDEKKLAKFIDIADSLGLSTLVEAHNEEELKCALRAKARIIGVNNRDLKTFEVDINNSIRLRKLAPDDIIFVAESGIKTPDDISRLRENRVNAVLIGETLMRAKDKKAQIEHLRGR